MTVKALIYCRVSSERQVLEGHGLDSQERLCLDYANKVGYKVVEVFRDGGTSGSLFDRPAMKDLLRKLEEYQYEEERVVVIFDDLKRFARDVQVHFGLKTEIYGRNGRVESPNFKFEDTPEGKFIETIMAAQAELERNQNKRQVIQKQKARIEAGYWSFCPPKGLKFIKDPVHGKLLSTDEPWATILKQAIEGYATGEFLTLEEVRAFISSEGQRLENGYKTSLDGVHRLLTELLYTGYVEYEPWGVARRKGHHQGFIDLETFNRVQDILLGRSKPRIRKDYNTDFPLRGLVSCGACERPFTGSWNKGRFKHYANYFCHTKDCQMRNKTISKGQLEGDFAQLLKQVTLPTEVTDLAKEVLSDTWEKHTRALGDSRSEAEQQIKGIDTQLGNLVTRSSRINNEEVVGVYERQMELLVAEKAQWHSKLTSKVPSSIEFGTALDVVISTLSNPISVWESGKYEDKRLITSMYFDGKLSYQKGVGFGTAVLEPNIALIRELGNPRTSLVEVAGIEPASEKEF